MSQDSNATGNVNPDIEQDSEQDLPEQIAVRLAKRERLNELNDAYPVSLPITTTIDAVRAKYPNLEIDVATGETVGLAGRVMFQRNTGKLCFVSLQAGSGERIQAMLDPVQAGDARAEVRRYQLWQPWVVDHPTVESAWAVESRWQLSYWDALMVGAAQQQGCSVLLTEDLQHDQLIDGVRILNPFITGPEWLDNPGLVPAAP